MIFEKQVLDGYKGMMYTRCDDTETVFYFSAEDFRGLRAEEFCFKSSVGHTMRGYIYSYPSAKAGRLIVFDHGFGGGHRAYMREIEKLCAHGYTVLSYDHTGCMSSEGASPGGLAHSLCDLNDCINAIKADERFTGTDISVMGHSWGGFSTLNISALHPDVSHIVVISGFVCVKEMVDTFFSGIMKGYRKAVMALEGSTNPEFINYHAVDTLKSSAVKALLIYSDDDKLCTRKHYDILKKALGEKPNVRFILQSGKGHNPNYTANAVKLLSEFTGARAKLLKNKKASAEDKARFISSFDWWAMTEQDETVWAAIFEHLDS